MIWIAQQALCFPKMLLHFVVTYLQLLQYKVNLCSPPNCEPESNIALGISRWHVNSFQTKVRLSLWTWSFAPNIICYESVLYFFQLSFSEWKSINQASFSVGEAERWTTQGSSCHFSWSHDRAQQAAVWLLGIQGHSKGKWILIVMLCCPTTNFLSRISL